MHEITLKFMNQPEKILIDREQLTLEGIKQYYVNLDDDNQDNIEFARIEGIVADASNGAEGGKLKLSVADK